MLAHIAGSALVAGYSELIVYPATSVGAVQRLLVEVDGTRVGPYLARAHLHMFLPESAGLGLGPMQERLAGRFD